MLRETAIRGDESLQHRHDQSGRLDGRAAIGQQSAIVDEVTMELSGQFHHHLHRLIVGQRAEFELRHSQFL